ncbi:hypothetical protein [Streptomyces thermolineatus]
MADSAPPTGEALALGLVNARPAGACGRVDLLAAPRQLSDWPAPEGDRPQGEVRGTAPAR